LKFRAKMVLKASKNEGNVVHVKIGFEQALNSKKQLLAGQIDVLKLMKGINKYFQYRRSELELREEMKMESRELNEFISDFKLSLPRVGEQEKFKIKEDLASINRREVLESDLLHIKERLARLGGM